MGFRRAFGEIEEGCYNRIVVQVTCYGPGTGVHVIPKSIRQASD